MTEQTSSRRSLSIRWKVLLLAGMVLCLTGSLFVLQHYRHQIDQFDQSEHNYRVRTEELLTRLFELQGERLQIQGRLFAGIPSVQRALLGRDGKQMVQDIEGLWSELNMGQGLRGVSIHDRSGRMLAGWGEHDASVQDVRILNVATQQDTPLSWLECGSQCVFQAVVPVIHRGGTVGVIALTGSMESIILDLRQLADAEVALYTGAPGAEAQPLQGLQLQSASGGEPIVRLLATAAGGTWQAQHIQLTQGGRVRQLELLPAPVSDGRPAWVLFVRDVTGQIETIHSAATTSLVFGAGGTLLALVMLFYLLRPTMRRFEHLAGLLPLLGEERFEQVRQRFAARPQTRFSDETDELEALAVTLSDRLERMREEARAHLRNIAAQARALERERDLLSSVFETAPVLILSYGRDRRIRMANLAAEEASNVSRDRLIGKDFAAKFLDMWQRKQYASELARMASGEVYHGESSIQGSDGQMRDVVWFHTRLAQEPGETPTYLSIGLDVTQHRQTERQLNRLTERDAVTGLLNRRVFRRELDARLGEGERGILLVCDVDQFKVLNEEEGHEAGDLLLRACAEHLQQLVPEPSLLGRLGNDEFALVFPGLTNADAIVLARQLNHLLPPHSGPLHTAHAVTTCVGAVQFPDHGKEADALLGCAQFALQHAQEKGHGSWHLYSADDPYRDLVGKRVHWNREVELALEEGRFVMHYQPIVQVVGGEISHYEALLRLIGRDGALVYPDLFIPAAESTGLIRKLDCWVIDAVAAFVAGHPGLKVALNLSGRSFDDDLAFEAMRDALTTHQVDGARIQIEITETAALANLTNATRVMAQLRTLGCAFGLDDFGVGYSSFQYLKELPVDFVKIDGSFIRNMSRNADDAVFVRALNEAVHGYGKRTVAEFVEDEATLLMLREIGVDCVQGYLLGRPAPI